MTDEAPKRGPGRPPKPKSAKERLAAMELKRHENGGTLIPRPQPLTFESFEAWLKQLSEVGSAGDVQIAWHYVNDYRWKQRLINKYGEFCAIAGRRQFQLEQEAAEEERQADVEHQRRTAEANRQREIARLEAKLAEMRS